MAHVTHQNGWFWGKRQKLFSTIIYLLNFMKLLSKTIFANMILKKWLMARTTMADFGIFYQKEFETSIDQLIFMNLVDGENWFRFTYFHQIYWVMFYATYPLVLKTAANHDSFFLQNCFQNNFFSFLSCKLPQRIIYPNSQFAVSKTCGYSIHSFKDPVWNLESRQIIVCSYKKHKNLFLWKQIKLDEDFPSLTRKLILIWVHKQKQNG